MVCAHPVGVFCPSCLPVQLVPIDLGTDFMPPVSTHDPLACPCCRVAMVRERDVRFRLDFLESVGDEAGGWCEHERRYQRTSGGDGDWCYICERDALRVDLDAVLARAERLEASLAECVARLRHAASYDEAESCEDVTGRELCPWCNHYLRSGDAHAADCTGITTLVRAEALLKETTP